MTTSATHIPFSGEYLHSLDEKNRVTIPAEWRGDGVSPEFFVVPDQRAEFLIVMPPDEFHRVSQVVESNASISAKDKRTFIRQFYSRARRCGMDRQGRILIPDEHRTQVGLADEVMLVGTHARFEIWQPARWTRVCEIETVTFQQVSDLVGL